MEGESGLTRTIIDILDTLDFQGDQMDGESGFTGGIIDELHSSDVQVDPVER